MDKADTKTTFNNKFIAELTGFSEFRVCTLDILRHRELNNYHQVKIEYFFNPNHLSLIDDTVRKLTIKFLDEVGVVVGKIQYDDCKITNWTLSKLDYASKEATVLTLSLLCKFCSGE